MVYSRDVLEEGINYLGNLKVSAAVTHFKDITTDHPEHGLAWMDYCIHGYKRLNLWGSRS